MRVIRNTKTENYREIEVEKTYFFVFKRREVYRWIGNDIFLFKKPYYYTKLGTFAFLAICPYFKIVPE